MAIIRAKTSFLVIAPGFCRLCRAGNVLTAIVVPAGHRYSDNSAISWEIAVNPSILYDIQTLNDEAINFISKVDPHWHLGTSKISGAVLYMNHCHKCGQPQDDFWLQKLNGPLLPVTDDEINDLRIRALDLPVIAIGQYAYNALYHTLIKTAQDAQPGAS